MINREITEKVIKHFNLGKVILIFGARQVGKTTLIKQIFRDLNIEPLYFNGDESDSRNLLSDINVTKIKHYIGNNKFVFIDEAQRIENIGLTLKILVDNFPDVQVVATGSSSFELADKINEPLTGRNFSFKLFPLSFRELVNTSNLQEEIRNVEKRLIFGYYPEVVTKSNLQETLLGLLAESYLYKDILNYEQIRKPAILSKILNALALQIGNEVSYSEISRLVGVNLITVEKYIDILEKAFIIFRLPALGNNVRTEIRKGKKIFFCDNGIRNAVLGNYSNLNNRNDAGALWENFLMSERMKYLKYNNHNHKMFFWRTVQMQEIDYIEIDNDSSSAYEFKYSSKSRHVFSKTFTNKYHPKITKIINKDNFYEFLID